MVRRHEFYITLFAAAGIALVSHGYQGHDQLAIANPRVGMFGFGEHELALRFGVNVSVEYTDNRDSVPSDKDGNMDIFVRPYVAYHLDGVSTRLHLRYQPGLRYRSDPGDNQNDFDLNHRLTLGVTRTVTPRARVRLNNTFVKVEDPPIEEGGAILRAERGYMLNTLRTAFNYDIGHMSNLDLAARNQFRRFDDSEIASSLDRNNIGFDLEFRHGVSHTVIALFSAAYDAYSLKRDEDRSRDFDSLTASAGMEYLFLPELIGSLTVGGQTHSYDDPELQTGDNLYVRAELSGNVGYKLRMGITTGYGVRDADIARHASQEYIEARGFANYDVTAKLTIRGALTYRNSTYDAKPDLEWVGGDEDVIVIDAQITYKINDMMSIYAGHRFEDVSADEGLSASFTRNTMRLGMLLDF